MSDTEVDASASSGEDASDWEAGSSGEEDDKVRTLPEWEWTLSAPLPLHFSLSFLSDKSLNRFQLCFASCSPVDVGVVPYSRTMISPQMKKTRRNQK